MVLRASTITISLCMGFSNLLCLFMHIVTQLREVNQIAVLYSFLTAPKIRYHKCWWKNSTNLLSYSSVSQKSSKNPIKLKKVETGLNSFPELQRTVWPPAPWAAWQNAVSTNVRIQLPISLLAVNWESLPVLEAAASFGLWAPFLDKSQTQVYSDFKSQLIPLSLKLSDFSQEISLSPRAHLSFYLQNSFC